MIVRDVSGTPIANATVTSCGPGSRETTTDAKGAADLALGEGTCRLRFEREGFVTLEREVTIRNGRAPEVEWLGGRCDEQANRLAMAEVT